ncbi:MAG: type II secretion system GspH family protein [Anaerohalosphaeraceae bacterium]|nr:type II secretion system GspH family protein [Anaerohalosphaeraceae bacterium]
MKTEAKNKNRNKKAFTVVELITVISVIAILVGVLLPALIQVKKMANNTKQKAQIQSIGVGLDLFKNDFGDYPPSHGFNSDYIYTGAQTLAEAMFGYDLLGVHPDTEFKDGDPLGVYDSSDNNNILARRGPYLERTNIDVFQGTEIFIDGSSVITARYLICDVFKVAKRDITTANGIVNTKVGTPILYYKADTSKTDIASGPTGSIYNYNDNRNILNDRTLKDDTVTYASKMAVNFYPFITDPIVTTPVRPVRPDSFLLISAGADGYYGTTDDICNFTPNL